MITLGFPSGTLVKNPPANAGDTGLIPGLGDPLEEDMQPTPLFLLGNPMDRGAWWATVRGITKSQT